MTDSNEYEKQREIVLKAFTPEFGQLGIDLLYFIPGGDGDLNGWIRRFNVSKQENKFQELDTLVNGLVKCFPVRLAAEQPSTLLLRAVRLKNVDLFELFYEEGNSNDPPKKPELHFLYESAIYYGSTDIVKYILNLPYLDGTVSYGHIEPSYVSPLELAILSLRKEIVQLLVNDKKFDFDYIIPDAIDFALVLKINGEANFEYVKNELNPKDGKNELSYNFKFVGKRIPLKKVENAIEILNDIISSLLDSLSLHKFLRNPLNKKTECIHKSMDKLFNYFIDRRYSNKDNKFLTKMLSMCDTNYLIKYYKRLQAALDKPFSINGYDKNKDELYKNELLSLIRNNFSFLGKVKTMIFKGGYISKTRRILTSAKRRLKRTIRKRKYQITRRQPKQKYIK